MLAEFFANHWASILLSLVSAGLLAFCRYIWKQMKNYKKLLDEKEANTTEELIDSKIEPIIEDIEELRTYIRETRDIEKSHMKLIIASYRYRLVQLCKAYLKQGYMTGDQFDQITEFYKLYTGLGGNGQAKEFFDKVCSLEIRPDDLV